MTISEMEMMRDDYSEKATNEETKREDMQEYARRLRYSLLEMPSLRRCYD